MLLDTGSSDCILASTACAGCPQPAPRFDGVADTNKPLTTVFGKGYASFYPAYEANLTLGDSNVALTTIGSIYEQSSDFGLIYEQGLLGMAYRGLSTLGRVHLALK